MKNVLNKLLIIQHELKAPKGQYNSFGKYKYRSCEDILEAVKPLAHSHECLVTLSDVIVTENERYYVMATATLFDCVSGECISNTAYAREDAEKKGMDGSQITGTASSYARKYALNGLFAIDDTKDADTDEYKNQTNVPTCENCGKPLYVITKRDGTTWEIADQVTYSKRMYKKCLCGNCMKAEKKKNES